MLCNSIAILKYILNVCKLCIRGTDSIPILLWLVTMAYSYLGLSICDVLPCCDRNKKVSKVCNATPGVLTVSEVA